MARQPKWEDVPRNRGTGRFEPRSSRGGESSGGGGGGSSGGRGCFGMVLLLVGPILGALTWWLLA